MKSFNKQFTECNHVGLVGKGIFKKFDDNPELIPRCPEKAKKMVETGCKGVRLLSCLRFSGRCSSKNIDCQKLRGMNV